MNKSDNVKIYNISKSLKKNSQEQTLLRKGPFKCYVTVFYHKFDTHPPLRNARPLPPPPTVTLTQLRPPPPVHDKLCQVQFPGGVVSFLGAWEAPGSVSQ